MLTTNAWVLLFIFFLDGHPNVVHDHFEEQCQCETVLKLLRQVHEEGVGYCKPGNIKYSLNGKPITLTSFSLENWPSIFLQLMTYEWPDLILPPLNLLNFPEWRYSYMSDGMTDWMRDHQEKAPHADHYRQLSPEPITVIENWKLNFNLGNAIKYISRCNYKGNKKADLQKAIWYLERELNNKNEHI